MDEKVHFQATKPCRRGHLGLRYVSTGNCVECHKSRDRSDDHADALTEIRPGVVILRNLTVPREDVSTIQQIVLAMMVARGLRPGPDPTLQEVPLPDSNSPASAPRST